MKEQEGNRQEKFDPKNEDEFRKELSSNKKAMFDILRKAPKVGVYKGQTAENWEIFFKFYLDFLRSEIGPRGECAKQVRKELMKEEQLVNKLLAPFKLRATTHIRQIYMKIKNFVPCEEYVQLKKIEQARERFVVNIEKFEDENSPMVKGISSGLIKKHGAEFDLKGQLSALKENYIKRVKEADESIKRLYEVLNKCDDYHFLVEAESYLEPYFKMWKIADSELGRENVRTGHLFEERVFKKIVPYLVYRQEQDGGWHYQQHRLEVFTNLSWIPKSLGEIDIAFGYRDEKLDRYFITTLIECKSRLFDLREAWKQVSMEGEIDLAKGPTFQELKAQKRLKIKAQKEKCEEKAKQKQKKREKQEEAAKDIEAKQQVTEVKQIKEQKQKEEKVQSQVETKEEEKEAGLGVGKKFLSTKFGPAELVAGHHFYIITTLPQNQFVLPIESRMKEGIDKFTKNMFIEDIQSEPLHKSLLQRFQEVLSPLDWIEQYQNTCKGESNIIVLK